MYFKDETEISELVRAFETCEIHPAEFKHYQHLAVALWYLKHHPYEAASEKMRRGIQRLAAAYGKTGYHETITIFWLKVVHGFLLTADSRATIFDLANKLASEYGHKNVIAEYYSEDILASVKAKSEWMEPDLKALEVDRFEIQGVEIMKRLERQRPRRQSLATETVALQSRSSIRKRAFPFASAGSPWKS